MAHPVLVLRMDPVAPSAPTAHSWFDDTHALIAGSLFVALGMTMFGHAGLLALLRHQASVGGVNILAQWLQQSRGFSAGKVQMSVDLMVVLAALWVLPPLQVAQSVVGAIAIGAILALNHKPGRYLGV